jgi:predicted DCC family thiol-disulfide oxidoreductase YuxK
MIERGLSGATQMRAVILYDGICGLCDAFIRFVLGHDEEDMFRFAPLQSRYASEALARHGISVGGLDAVYVIATLGGSEAVLARSRAIAFVLEHLPHWTWCGRLLDAMPRPLADAAYDVTARARYRLFGRLSQCPLPNPKHRGKFLGV